MNRLLLTTLALGAILTTAVFAEKQKGEGDRPQKRPPPGMEHLLPPPLVEKLNLTAAQKAELEKLDKAFVAAREKHRAEHQDEMQELRQKMKAARQAGDKARADQLAEQMRALREPLMTLRRDYVQQFAATLTPEQKATLDASREKWQERREKRRDKPPAKL
jgi:Spy/CpxP family protein refolding chaperone